MAKVDEFVSTGKTTCNKHGLHGEWTFVKTKFKKKNGKIYKYRTVVCRICSRERTKGYCKKHPTYQDDYRFSYNGIICRVLAQARNRARKKHLKFELDKHWLEQQLKNQNNKCKYSGITFKMTKHKLKGYRHPFLPSIDQIKPSNGYTKNNSALVCTIINIMKHDLPLDDFIKMCKKIAYIYKV